MKVLFVGTKAGVGGTETHFVELARAVAEAGHEVGAVVRPGSAIETGLRAAPNVRLFAASFERASDPVATFALARIAQRFRPDWMVGSFKREYYSIVLVARLRGAGVALFQHNALPTRRMTTFALPRICDVLLVPSQYLQRHLVERGMPSSRIRVLYNPVDTQRFHADEHMRTRMRTELGFTNDDVVLGFAGRIESEKGADVLAAAFTRAAQSDARLRMLWVGAGKWVDALRQHIAAQGETERHVITDWVDDTRPYYAAMDVLALPSTRSETFGRTCVEAQACGVPVIGSILGGIPETMQDGLTGVLVPPGDVDAWSGAIVRMTDATTRSAMGKAGPSFVAGNFGAPQIARDFVALLESYG